MYFCIKIIELIKKAVNILLAILVILAHAGILINKHFSGSSHYSSALYIAPENCCDNPENNQHPLPDYDHHNISTCSHCTTEDVEESFSSSQDLSNGFIWEQQDFCSDKSSFFQLSATIFPEKPEKKHYSYFSLYFVLNEPTHGLFNSKSTNPNCYSHSPPLLGNAPIWLQNGCFRC